MDTDFSYLGQSHHRLFLALTPPHEFIQEVRDIYRKFSKEARNLSFVPLNQLHLTIQFLGTEVSTDSLNLISQAFRTIELQLQQITIKTNAIRFGFKGQRIPQIIYLAINDSNELKEFTRQVHSVIKSLGLYDTKRKKDYAKLIYHITLARVKHNTSKSYSKTINQIISQMDVSNLQFTAQNIYLIKSEVEKKQQIYQLLQTVQLKKADSV